METEPNDRATVRVIATPKTWIESEAVAQLERTAALPGMRLAVGLPDLHAGKGHPIGAAFLSQGVIHPRLVGNDIGCGMGLWATDLPARKLKLDAWTKRLGDLDGPWDGDREAWLAEGKPQNPGRLNDLRHIVYKKADEPWRRARRNLFPLRARKVDR